jgi:hypothetical protein
LNRKSNIFIAFLFGVLVVLSLACFCLFYFTDDNKFWYLDDTEAKLSKINPIVYNLIVLVFYSQLLNYIMPLNMYVTIGIYFC